MGEHDRDIKVFVSRDFVHKSRPSQLEESSAIAGHLIRDWGSYSTKVVLADNVNNDHFSVSAVCCPKRSTTLPNNVTRPYEYCIKGRPLD